VQDDDGESRRGFRPRDIGAERAVPAFYGEAILRCALGRRSFLADVVTIGEGLLSDKPALQAGDVTPQAQLKISSLSDAALTQLRHSLFRAFPSERLEKNILGRLQCSRVG
jgi:hypothetical protein